MAGLTIARGQMPSEVARAGHVGQWKTAKPSRSPRRPDARVGSQECAFAPMADVCRALARQTGWGKAEILGISFPGPIATMLTSRPPFGTRGESTEKIAVTGG